jgi:lysophospholipase L1-like esterase
MAPFTIYKNLPSQKSESFAINSIGLRGPEIGRKGRRSRILVVGGSAAFGYGAAADEETFQRRMMALDPRLEVLNAGVVGFHSGQELTYLVTELIDLVPDVVVAFDAWNDLHDSVAIFPRTRTELGFNNSFFQLERTLLDHHKWNTRLSHALAKPVQLLLSKSRLITSLSDRMRRLRSEDSDRKYRPEAEMPRLVEEVADSYTLNLLKMDSFCRASGARFLVAIQPELGHKAVPSAEEVRILEDSLGGLPGYQERFVARYRQFVNRSLERLRRQELEVVDLSSHDRFVNDPRQLFSDVVHLTEAGNRVVAEILIEELARRDWIRPVPP